MDDVEIEFEVLIVDADPKFRSLLESMFEIEGMRVIVSESANEALDRFHEHVTDLVILNHRLADVISGLEMAPLLKQLDPGVKVIVYGSELGDSRRSFRGVDATINSMDIYGVIPLAWDLLGRPLDLDAEPAEPIDLDADADAGSEPEGPAL